jgi:hypothetical protein
MLPRNKAIKNPCQKEITKKEECFDLEGYEQGNRAS